MNVRDTEVVCGMLKAAGFNICASPEEADVVIINTCSVRQHAEDKVWSEIGRIKKAGTAPVIGVIGCMAQNYQEDIFDKAPNVSFVVGPADIEKIPAIISKFTGKKSIFERKIYETEGLSRPEKIYHSGFYEDKVHAYVVISEGCSNYCSYCVVPYVRGLLHNRSYKDILREIEEAVDKGITRFTLLGQSVNAYIDKEVNFIKLISMVNAVRGLNEFSFITSHPKDTGRELFKAMAGADKLKKYLHLPVQSGSDRILKLMNRAYSKSLYLDLVDNYRKIVKGGLLSSDVIIGFPTESEDDFRETYDLVKNVEFNAAYIFKYSPRPKTQALNLSDDITRQDKEARHKAILDLQKGISRNNAKRHS